MIVIDVTDTRLPSVPHLHSLLIGANHEINIMWKNACKYREVLRQECSKEAMCDPTMNISP